MRMRDYKKRNSFLYKIKMLFYRLTFRDIKVSLKKIFAVAIEFVIALLGFLFIFSFHGFFH